MPDALGSVSPWTGTGRQAVDAAGAVVAARAWSPYGVAVGGAQAGLGYTGEWFDASVGLQYLRARWYDVQSGRFTQFDPVLGVPGYSRTEHRYAYAYNAPTILSDSSGLSPLVDCTNWPTYLGLRDLCRQANGDDTDADVLQAREAIFVRMAYGGQALCVVEGKGYCWASRMLLHFLDEDAGSEMQIRFRATDPFPQDPGILRATKDARAPSIRDDEPDTITPLLHAWLVDYVRPLADSSFTIPMVDLTGSDYYSDQEPRAYDTGFWAAFGHVSINGRFSGKGKMGCNPEGYILTYEAEYHIDDDYLWYTGKSTPFQFPGTSEKVWIPHEWELSLVNSVPPRAHTYSFQISWQEKERLVVGEDFTWYRELAWWELGF